MKKYSSILIILFSACQISAQADDFDRKTLSYIRDEFYLAVEDENSAESLLKFLKGNFNYPGETTPAKILAYTGAVEAVMAKHVFNPYSKFKYVINGLKKLNNAVEQSPDLLEVRFLRFAVLHNIPGVFGVTDERKSDMEAVYESLLKKNYSDIDYDLQKGIAGFLINSGRLTPDQQDNLLLLFPENRNQ